MKEAIPTYDADTALTKLIKLLGPPPLLRNENFDDFKEVFAELFAALGPEDFLIEVDVYHLSIETWRIFRLTRYEAVMLNKGPHIVRAVQTLDDILQRMEAHQMKKQSMMRELNLARTFMNVIPGPRRIPRKKTAVLNPAA